MNAAAAKLANWRRDAVAFVRENFHVEPDEWQREALMAYCDPTVPRLRLSLQACAGPGKSAVLAWIGWHFISCNCGPNDMHPKGACTSVTGDNLKDNLWAEMARWRGVSPFLSATFTWTQERIFSNEHPATWFLSVKTWPKAANADEQGKTLSGLHSDYVIVLIDESGSIPVTVLRAGEQALSNCKFGRIVQAGNPLSREGMLFHAAQSDQWRVIRITGDPDDLARSPRIDLEWAREQIKSYGRSNPWVQAYILGEFPLSALNTLLGPDEVRDAMKRYHREFEIDHAPRILGVDVAREGDDSSCIFPRQGRQAFPPTILRNVDGLQGGGAVALKWKEWGVDAVFVDNTGGFGASWVDQLRALGRSPIPIHFASAPSSSQFVNKRAEMWWLMAQWVKEGGALPDCPELVAELCTPTYFFKGDKIQIEEKLQIKERLHRSPDRADALALTFAQPVTKTNPSELAKMHFGGGQNARQSWNPLASRPRR